MGGLSRRFLNLIMDNRIHGAKSLCCIDITCQQFFNTTKPAAESHNRKGSQSKMSRIQLPSPSFSIRGSTSGLSGDQQPMHFLPVADRRVVCVDELGRGVLLEADTGNAVIMPPLHKPKLTPISLPVPSHDLVDHHDLFIMERVLKPEPSCSTEEQTYQFEAFVYRKPASTYFSKSWQCQTLPLLPCLHYTKQQWHSFPHISSYAVVNGGSEICISVQGLGTYCLDTRSYKWTQVGEWTLPFCGKVDHVPELKLWFGISAGDKSLAAADLSAMDSQPQLLGSRWKEIADLPEEWKECKDSQLVNLGSGKFCIARFFHTMTQKDDTDGDQNLAVLTGVEMAQHGHDSNNDNGSSSANANANASGGSGRVELRFLKHKSRCYKSNSSNGTVTAVF